MVMGEEGRRTVILKFQPAVLSGPLSKMYPPHPSGGREDGNLNYRAATQLCHEGSQHCTVLSISTCMWIISVVQATDYRTTELRNREPGAGGGRGREITLQ